MPRKLLVLRSQLVERPRPIGGLVPLLVAQLPQGTVVKLVRTT